MKKLSKSATARGVLGKEDLAKLPGIPSEKRLKKGPVAIIECAAEYPCNPCESACREQAIRVGKDITDLPALDEDRCTGCGVCIPACPGLAIFVVDLTYSEKEAVVRIPHELLPLPGKNETVKCLNREGKSVTEGKVVKVVNPKRNDRTAVIWVAVPKKFAQGLRAIRVNHAG